MKWWKRMLRRRLKRVLGLNEWQRALRLSSIVFRIISGILVFNKSLQRKDTKMVIRMFGRMLSKRY